MFAQRLTPYLITLLILTAAVSSHTNVIAQTPIGNLGGVVTDAAAAVVIGAQIQVRQDGTNVLRRATTDDEGHYQVSNLPPGKYLIEAQCTGFKTDFRRLTLRVGDNLSVDFALQPGSPSERVEVIDEPSGVDTTNYRVAGTVGRTQIEGLPLNGRSFFELAQLEPGVQVSTTTNPGGLGNTYTQVFSGGSYFSQTRTSVDGSTISDRFTGGTTQSFSQESVQEFQISTFNLDLTTGIGAAGSINIVTRHGSNEFHGSGFFYFRDHNLSAYPALRRDPITPSPFFARRQGGFSMGGPIKRDRVFWFTNFERNNQDAVFAVTNNHPIFSKFDGIFPNPLLSDYLNVRVDSTINDRVQAFARYSSDHNSTLAPAIAVGLPSNWQLVRNRGFQAQLGLVTVPSPRLVNDLRFSHSYLGGHLTPPGPEVCNDPVACIGLGGPNILVFDAPQFRIGNQQNSPFDRWLRTWQVVDNVTLEHGKHRFRFGGSWEHVYLKASLAFIEPAQIILWGPTNLQTPALLPLYNALPNSLKDPNSPPPTLAEILQLPFRSFTTGIGNPSLPAPYNFDDASRDDRPRLYFQDEWRVRSNVTLSFGLAYSYESNLFDNDLSYPQYLNPLFAGNAHPPRNDKNNFDPAAGVAWSLGKSARTVIRFGGGIYRDETVVGFKARDRAFIGPSGNGRVLVDGSITGFNFVSTPSAFTGQDFLPLLPGLRANLASRFGNGTDLSVRGIETIKQGDQILDPDAKTGYSIQVNAGVQRELGANFLLTADYVMRRYVNIGALQGVFLLDRNRFNRPSVTGVDPNTGVVSFVRNPIIPLCTPAQSVALNPADQCSTGPINVYHTWGTSRYQGLHVKLERRFTKGLQLTVGYALAKNTGFVDLGITSFDDLSLAYGNIPNQRRHRVTVSGLWAVPEYKGNSKLSRALRNSWTVSFISQTFSAPPLDTVLTGLDLDGDGISLTLLPGTTRHNLLGQGMSNSELRQLVETYNAGVEARTRRVTNPDGSVTVIRPRTPFNQIINPIVLPATFSNGDPFVTQDVRLTRKVKLREHVDLSLIAEAFNLFNIANLTGYSGTLNQPNYGQASARVGQVFGTGGPRAFQFAARLTF